MTPLCEVTLDELLGLRIEDALQIMEGAYRGAATAAPRSGRITVWANAARSMSVDVGDHRALLFLARDRSVTVYAKKGSVVLGILRDRDVVIKTVAELKDLEKLITDFYDKNIVHCSKCGCEVDRQKAFAAGHTRYAGTYCDSCADTDSFKQDKLSEGL